MLRKTMSVRDFATDHPLTLNYLPPPRRARRTVHLLPHFRALVDRGRWCVLPRAIQVIQWDLSSLSHSGEQRKEQKGSRSRGNLKTSSRDF